jgi:drug/metabolite transporter (DMT)-like permease
VTRTISPLAATTASVVLAFPLLVVTGGYDLAAHGHTEIPPVALAGFLYVGIVAGVAAFLSWSAGIGRLGAARGAIFLNLIPVFTAAIAVLALGERLVAAQALGGLLVLLGVSLVSYVRREKVIGGGTTAGGPVSGHPDE